MFLLDRLNIVANLLEKIMSHNRNIMFQQDATVLRRAHETVKLLKTVTPDFTKQSGLEHSHYRGMVS